MVTVSLATTHSYVHSTPPQTYRSIPPHRSTLLLRLAPPPSNILFVDLSCVCIAQGRVFVVGAADGRILCYNPLMVDRGPCAAGSLPAARMPSSSSSVNWTGMSISPDDDVIVYSTQQAGCGVVNAVNLNPIAELSPGDDALARPIPSGVSLAPDNKSFIMADALGHILTYDLSHIKDSSPYIPPGVAVGSSPPPDSALRGSAVAVEDYTAPKHKRPVQALKWHPDRKLIASADTELALWIDPSS